MGRLPVHGKAVIVCACVYEGGNARAKRDGNTKYEQVAPHLDAMQCKKTSYQQTSGRADAKEQ